MSPGAAGDWTLALDTATPATVAAAAGPRGSASRIAIPAPGERPGHTRLLLALADEALREAGGDLAAVRRIVLGVGPGTFTGIRVGVATGRALALACGAALVGVPTPAALAQAATETGGGPDGPTLVVQDARRRELFLTLYPAGGPVGAEPVGPWTVPQDGLAEALAGLRERPGTAVGDGAVAFSGALRAAGVVVPDDPAAHAVDGLALLRAAAETVPGAPEDVRPLYVRDADAVPTAERR